MQNFASKIQEYFQAFDKAIELDRCSWGVSKTGRQRSDIYEAWRAVRELRLEIEGLISKIKEEANA